MRRDTFLRLGGWDVSPDHRLLAYTVDTSGAEAFTLYVKELSTGALLAETMTNVSPSLAWANDSRTLFYVVLDDARRWVVSAHGKDDRRGDPRGTEINAVKGANAQR